MSHDPSEIIIVCWVGLQDGVLVSQLELRPSCPSWKTIRCLGWFELFLLYSFQLGMVSLTFRLILVVLCNSFVTEYAFWWSLHPSFQFSIASSLSLISIAALLHLLLQFSEEVVGNVAVTLIPQCHLLVLIYIALNGDEWKRNTKWGIKQRR